MTKQKRHGLFRAAFVFGELRFFLYLYGQIYKTTSGKSGDRAVGASRCNLSYFLCAAVARNKYTGSFCKTILSGCHISALVKLTYGRKRAV